MDYDLSYRRRNLPATVLLRALGYTSEEILAMFYDVNVFTIGKKGEYIVELVPDRMRGEVATFDICEPERGEVSVEAGRRITARHIRPIERSGISQLEVPAERSEERRVR